MFDIAWSEFLVVAVVALVVVGPRDLPGLLRNVGRMMGTVRRMAGEFQSQFNEALREAELDELRREVTGLKDSASKLVSGPDPFAIARKEIKSAMESPAKPATIAAPDTPSAFAGAPGDPSPAVADTPSAFAPEPPPAEPPPVTAADFIPEGASPPPADVEPSTATPPAASGERRDAPGAAS
jgi:sec-independent protein translocase protein TatB